MYNDDYSNSVSTDIHTFVDVSICVYRCIDIHVTVYAAASSEHISQPDGIVRSSCQLAAMEAGGVLRRSLSGSSCLLEVIAVGIFILSFVLGIVEGGSVMI